MSKLEELLKRECPDGVEWKKLDDVSEIKSGRNKIKNKVGKYPVYGSTDIIAYSDDYVFDKPHILIARVGVNAGYVHIADGLYDVSDNTLIITELNPDIYFKYMYYILINTRLNNYIKGGGIPLITAGEIKNISIPVPPIEVQKEIVRILDEFTEKTNKLQELLHRETILRKKQYEYYRDKLLTFTDEVEYVPLWSVTIWDKKFNSVDRKKQPEVINYPYLLASDLFAMEQDSGDVFLLSTGEKTGWTTEKIAGNNLCNGEVVTIPWGKSRAVIDCIKYYKGKFVTADNRIMTSKDKSKLNNKFLYYIIISKGKLIDTFYRGSGIKHPDMSKVLDIIIPLPPLEEQERIVKILDQFDTLCNDITKGLPAEIEMRKKQYEYYRDKLLTFKEKKK